MRRGEITRRDAAELAWRAETRMRGNEHPPDVDAVLALAARSNCTAYNLEFVSVAERLGVLLVTGDRTILRAFPHRARPLAAYA